MFDIQSKRLHEYKRQQLNLLYLIHQYHEIKAGHLPATPLVSIFGAKAAPAYTIAKDIIHALLTLSKVIAADPVVSKYLQVVFVLRSSSPPATCRSRSRWPPKRRPAPAT